MVLALSDVAFEHPLRWEARVRANTAFERPLF